jgi:WD40 repeat protein
VRKYELKTAQLLNTIASDSEYHPDHFSPDGALLAEASPVDNGAILHNLDTKTSRFLRQKELSHTGTALAFSADSRTLAVGDGKGFITLWRIR